MKNKIALFLILVIIISSCSILTSCIKEEKGMTPPTINGASLSEYTIVYDEQGLDYNKRAAEYIRDKAKEKYNLELAIVDDDSAPLSHEIIVGETSRALSASLNTETEGFEFSILAGNGSIALEGDYFVIAAAAYFFVETYVIGDGATVTVEENTSIHEPIVKESKNFILLIGDGMGVYQTKIFDYMENDVEYSDGENLFYGYMFPYIGSSRTESLSGITDSAAGGTALACGIKTINEYIGRDKDLNDVKSLTELAFELGKAAAVMSTEVDSGATPSSFAAHADSRNGTGEILRSMIEAQKKYGTIIDCGYDYYKVKDVAKIENHIEDTLGKVSANGNGFFLMYEEAYIDKNCHNNLIEGVLKTVVRFNQAIARFMEFAFYNPDTFVLITADHETGGLVPDENGNLAFHSKDHTATDVLIFAYGQGAELFNGVNIENIQIAHTIAVLMGEDNFGDQSVYQSLTKGK